MNELHRLLRALEATREDELDCAQVLAELASYVEGLTRAEERARFEGLERHLARCGCCREELRALRLALAPGTSPPGR